ncbi:MAG: glycosyltransferase [Gemmatimonadota bacterium]|nr:glycosyltransferase [Gemmatimonadota bacterium]
MVSVVLPIFNEEQNLEPLMEEIAAALAEVPHEVVAVDDGSTDGSLDRIRTLQHRFPALRVIVLDRRSGQSAATAAGFDAARGDVVVTLDADGQNDPRDISLVLQTLERNSAAAAVVGYRVARHDSRWKRLQSRIANTVRNLITRDRIRDIGCSLKAVRRSVWHDIPRFDGMHRFLPTLVRARGGHVLEVPVSHRPRVYGQSKYGMRNRAWRGLVDALGVGWYRRRALNYLIKEDSE